MVSFKKSSSQEWSISVYLVIAVVFIAGTEAFKYFIIPGGTESAIWQSIGISILIYTLMIYFSLIHIFGVKRKSDIQDTRHSTRVDDIAKERLKNWEETFDAIEDWISIITPEATILRSNLTVENYFQLNVKEAIGKKCCELVHDTESPVDACPLPTMLKTGKRSSTEIQINDGRWLKISVDPIFNEKGEITSAVHIVRDISKRIADRIERENLINNLKDAVSQIKALNGLLPICSKCKKIRDDKGYWNQLEYYIEEHTEASFSHGMCPDCSDQLYGTEDWYIDMKEAKKKKQ
jgi:PAS domain S-box-containing protein